MVRIFEIVAMCVLSCNSKYKMPPKHDILCNDNKAKDAEGSARSVTTKASIELPVSAVAGLQGEDAEQFEQYTDSCERACPSVHCWTPAGEVLIGCSTGELLKVVMTIMTVCTGVRGGTGRMVVEYNSSNDNINNNNNNYICIVPYA